MDEAALHRLIDGYLKNQAAWDDQHQRMTTEDWFWAWIDVNHMIREGSPDVMELILGLVDAARENEDALCSIGAGPLEDLINWHGERFAHEIEEAAERSPALRGALDCVRFADGLPTSVRERLARFVP